MVNQYNKKKDLEVTVTILLTVCRSRESKQGRYKTKLILLNDDV